MDSRMGEENKNETLVTEVITTPPPPESTSSLVATPPPEKTKSLRAHDKAGLEVVVTEKRLALIKAWEDNEKTKAENKAYTKISAIGAWENTKRAEIEADLKQIEVNIEIEKGKQREKMKNKMAAIHKEAEEKCAVILARRGQYIIKTEEAAAKFHATGTLPTRLFDCFGY